MIESGQYYAITNSEITNPLCVNSKKELVVASNSTTTPENQQFLATLQSGQTSSFSFLAVGSGQYVQDDNGKADANSGSAIYLSLTEQSDGSFMITPEDSTSLFLTIEAEDAGSKATFSAKGSNSSKKKQKWKFTKAVRRGPQPA